jgi:hypothetical protein
MIGRIALRSLTAHPIRSAILAAGFGVGVAVMAILLGVAEIVLEQAQAPALVGGGDVVIRMNRQVPARLLLAGTLQADALRGRIRVAAPGHTRELYLVTERGPARVFARGGIPSLERELGDPETRDVAAWQDSPADVAWTQDTPDAVLRYIDRFHPIPDAPEWQDSWAEWLYFNGRSEGARFYLTFLVGPRTASGRRASGVRLQLDRGGSVQTFTQAAELDDAQVAQAPDLTIGASSVRLDGMTYRIHLDLPGDGGLRAVGDLTLQASAGRLVPPLEISGVRGWRTGYVVPVMSGRLDGAIEIAAAGGPRRSTAPAAARDQTDGVGTASRVTFDGGTGYHDHNWGFWEGVSWQWGQVQHEDLSFLYGRVFPPADAADPERLPGFAGVLGRDGPLGYTTNVTIDEVNDANGRPTSIELRARGTSLDLRLRFDVGSVVTTRMSQGPLGNDVDFLQMRGEYTVRGTAAGRTIDFTAPGAAETFRGMAD